MATPIDTANETERRIAMPLGVVVERHELDNRWQKWRWQPVGVIPGAPPLDAWKELARGERWVRWHAATLPLELHRKETEAYKVGLSTHPPKVYVVLRRAAAPEPGREMTPFLVTASPFEAQDYLDSGEDVVEGVAMPEGVVAWVQAFVDRHHVDEPFKKRKRDRIDPDQLGRPPERARAPAAQRRGRNGGA